MMTEFKARTAPCIAGCGRQVPYKTNAKVVCDACFGERKRAKDRRAAERIRRKRGVAAVSGAEIECARCGRLTKRRGIKRRFCDECAPKAPVERSRSYQEARRRRIGLTELGTKQKCANCPEIFSKDSSSQIYCLECMVLQKANKLPSLRKSIAAWRRQRRVDDPSFAVNDNVRNSIRGCLQGAKAGRHWETLVGYTLRDLMRHLERQFVKGQTWENYGPVWHLDHIIPLSSFSFESADDPEFRRAWGLTNLRPLWAKDNLEKRAQRLHLL